MRRTVVSSDEDEDEEEEERDDVTPTQGDVTSDDENEGEESDGASTEQVSRRTRSRTLRQKTLHELTPPSDEEAPKNKMPRKKRSIDVKHMKGDRRVSSQYLRYIIIS